MPDWWRHLWEYLGRNMPLTTLSIDGWGLSAPPLPLQSPCISTKSGLGPKGALEVRAGADRHLYGHLIFEEVRLSASHNLIIAFHGNTF